MLGRFARRAYKVMNREEYRENMRIAQLAKNVDRLEMPDLLAADGGPMKKDEKVLLHAIPEQPVNKADIFDDPLFNTLYKYKPDLIYLQFNPMHYITRQRYITYQLAMKNNEEYNRKAAYSFDNPIPLSWDECCVNLITLDSITQNKTYEELDYTKGFGTYSYPTLQAYEVHKELTNPFINAITEHIAGRQWSKYHYINNILYLALMGKSKVILGDMPEQLLRLQLGNTIPLATVREIYHLVVEKLNEHYKENPGVLMTMEEMTMSYFPHIFQMPRDLYITAMLKETFPAGTLTAAFLGNIHYVPVQRYWVGPPMGINYTQATYVPPRIPNETEEMLIEKQALFDMLLDTKAWGEKYVTNPFLYLAESIEDIPKKDLLYFKNYFKQITSQYNEVRNQKLKFPDRMLAEEKKELKLD